MNAIDLAIIAIILVSSSVGVFRGFVREVLSLTAWLVALWVAFQHFDFAASYLAEYIAQPPLRSAAGFVAVFVLVLIAASLIGHLLCRLFAYSGISGIDRSLGLLFGFARGAVIVAVLLLLGAFLGLAEQQWWRGGVLQSYFDPLTDILRALAPSNLAGYIQPAPD